MNKKSHLVFASGSSFFMRNYYYLRCIAEDLNFLMAIDSSCLISSLVTPNSSATLRSERHLPSSSPYLKRTIRSSLSERMSKSSLTLLIAASDTSSTAQASLMNAFTFSLITIFPPFRFSYRRCIYIICRNLFQC